MLAALRIQPIVQRGRRSKKDPLATILWSHEHGLPFNNLKANRSHGHHTPITELQKSIHERMSGRGMAGMIMKWLPKLEDKDALVAVLVLLDTHDITSVQLPGNTKLDTSDEHRILVNNIKDIFSAVMPPFWLGVTRKCSLGGQTYEH
jgi:hypothetical protein